MVHHDTRNSDKSGTDRRQDIMGNPLGMSDDSKVSDRGSRVYTDRGGRHGQVIPLTHARRRGCTRYDALVECTTGCEEGMGEEI